MTSARLKLLLLCLAAFLLATIIAWGVFEAMPHLEDEFAYLFQAKVFASGHITAETPAQPKSFFIPFVVDREGQRFSKYPPGYSLLVALGALAGQPWLVNALAAALALVGVYLLGRDLFDSNTGLLASALGVISPLFVILSGSLLPHTVCLAELTFFAWAFVRARRADEPRRVAFSAAAGALLGMAAITRPLTALGIAIPFAALAAIDLYRSRGRDLARYAVMLLGLASTLSLMLWYNQVTSGSVFTNTYRLYWDFDTIGFGPGVGKRESGHTVLDAINNALYSLPRFGQEFLGWPVIVGLPVAGLVIGLGLLLPPLSKIEWGLILPPAGLVILYMLYWTSISGLYGTRYYSEAMPFLWILVARSLLKLDRYLWPRRVIRIALPLLAIWGILVSTWPRTLKGRGLYGITRRDQEAIASAGLEKALVFVWVQSWPDYAGLSWLNQPDLGGEQVFAQHLESHVNAAVMANFPDREVYYYEPFSGSLMMLSPP